ncbi:hypothetical protein OAB09_00220 [Pelagibacteraceae bacterium]|nr:hypothetical protein [Pelagibacteraceae bacterium]|tara:strand:+ start:209 stop:1228 length:1020 start_codon:yes stop_codon:yes gene_type:complete
MIIFRIDLGHKYGLGHYSRIKSLIKHLDLKRYKIVIDKFSDGSFLSQENNNIISLYQKNKTFKNELEDSKLFINLLRTKYKNSIIIKDSYRLNYKWEKNIKKYCKKIISIDDSIENNHYSDIYINHNPNFSNKNIELIKKLKIKNKKKCNFLLGPDYALFDITLKKTKIVNSDFVFYNGGSGDMVIYKKIIEELNKIKKFKITLIIGPYVKDYKTICKKYKNFKNINIIYKPENILNILRRTKIFISSAGISMFESSYLKLPTLLFKMNKNQNLSSFHYEKIGHYFCLEKKDLKLSKKIANLIYLMFNNRHQIQKMMSDSIININSIKKNFIKKFRNFK